LIEPKNDLITIYNFIDENKYRPVDPGTLKTDFGIGQDEKVIIHISNFRKVKRIPDIIISFKKVLKEIDAKLLLVGDGPERMDMEALVSEFGLHDKVIFTGKRDDLPELLAISDVMFHLSEKEAFGLVLLEALACGLPSIATDAGGIPEVIEDGVNGFLVKIGDTDKAAEKAILVLKDDNLRATFRENALATAADKFHSSTIVDQYERLYYEVAGNK
jgi:L-malate glycosyltransferase